MKSSELTAAQAKAIKDRVAPMLAYVNRLHARMEQRNLLSVAAIVVRSTLVCAASNETAR